MHVTGLLRKPVKPGHMEVHLKCLKFGISKRKHRELYFNVDILTEKETLKIL